MTVILRISDSVQIRSRKSTLPPPAFKTRVTQDPTSTTRRIHFDDFKETFNPADDDIEEIPLPPGESFRVISAERSDAASPAETPAGGSIPSHPPRESFSYTRDEETEPLERRAGEADGSFRVIPLPSTSRNEPAAAPEPSAEPGPEMEQPESIPLPSRNTEPVAAEKKEEVMEPVPIVGVPQVPAETTHTERVLTRTQVQNILEDLVSQEEEPKGSEPRGEFVRLVGQVLNAVARSIPARSIVFFWVNLEKGHLIPEAQVTSGSHEIRTGTRIAVGNDVISQIARSGIPDILTEISPAAERELIP
jgi:hypothetical protein